MISVIIPAYNVIQYLDGCMSSIFAQTFTDFEVILVDDGSEDGCSEKCDFYTKLDNRVHVIHQMNQGVSVARNMGMKCAKGEWIAFIDADDYISPDYFQTLIDAAIKNKVDIVACNYIEVGIEEVKKKNLGISEDRIIEGSDECLQCFLDSRTKAVSGTVWAKLIKKDIAIKYDFLREVHFGEDTLYMMKLFAEGPRVFFSTYFGYYYRRNVNSATMSRRHSEIALEHLKYGEMLAKYFGNAEGESALIVTNEFALRIYIALSWLIKEKDITQYKKNQMQLLYFSKLVLKKSILKVKYRVLLHIYVISPIIYWYLMKIILRMKAIWKKEK